MRANILILGEEQIIEIINDENIIVDRIEVDEITINRVMMFDGEIN